MTHKMNLHIEPFIKIKNGTKTIELRLNDEKRQKISPGDNIIFKCDCDEIIVRVAAIHQFENFEQLFLSLPLDKCGYCVDDLHCAKPSDMERYYSIEKQRQYGVLGIEIKYI